METSSHKPILGALLRAVVCWAALYLIVAHVYMFITWPSVVEIASTSSSSTEQHDNDNENDMDSTDDYRDLLKEAGRLKEQLKKSNVQHGEWLDTTQQKVSLLEHNANQLKLKPPALESQKVKLPQLHHLLNQPNLESWTEKELAKALSEVSKEIDTIVNQLDKVAYEGWQSILDADYPREPPMPKRCGDSEDDESGNVSPDTARLSDLYSRVQQVEAAMAKRKDKQQPLTSESTERVIASIQTTAEQSLDHSPNDKDDNDDESNDDDNCVGADEVEWLVDEGLNALLRHKDLRMVLQQALSELDEEAAKKVILDAVLTSGTKSIVNDSKSNTINLRHVLDTPLVSQKSPQWIDGAVEHISGHVDLVDDTLDSLLDDDNDSVGKIVVSKVLGAAGRVNVPNPYTYIDSKAGMLRP